MPEDCLNPGDAAMARYARGERAAFAEVYDAVVPRIFPYLRRQTGSLVQAEDVLQQTLFHMHRGAGTFVPGSAVLPWAFAIARRLLVDERRRARRNVLSTATEIDAHDLASPIHAGPDGEASAKELAGSLQRALQALPASQREAFELVRLDGLSLPEAAAVVGVSVSALKFRAHRALVAMRAAVLTARGILADELDDAGPVSVR